ncbi:MAG: dGTP triphosphohydrolase, partial [Halothermotrichaceae bacterium]
MNNEKDIFIVLRYKLNEKSLEELDNKLEKPPYEDDVYIYNKLPQNIDEDKKYNIIIFGFATEDIEEKIFIGDAHVENKKLIIENTYKLNKLKKKKFIKLYEKERGVSLSEDKYDKFGTHKFVFLRKLDRDKYNTIINLELGTKPPIRPGEYQVYKGNKIESINILEKNLDILAQKSSHAKRALGIKRPDNTRSEFERDRDRIIHSRSYRRLVDKAQVYNTDKGDHYRTRMTHTLEVKQIARNIARNLNLNEDLTEAIALGHDIGHTPFGHQGERQLSEMYKKKMGNINKEENDEQKLKKFKHNFQSIKVLNYLEEKYEQFPGLDLTYQVYEGVLKHTKFKLCHSEKSCSECDTSCIDDYLILGESKYLYLEYPFPTTLEGQIIYWADEIAQAEHDLDDGLTNGNIELDKLIKDLKFSIKKISDSGLNEKKHLEDLISIIENHKSIRDDNSREKDSEYIDKDDIIYSEIVTSVTGFFIKKVIETSKKNIEKYKKEVIIGENGVVINQKVIGFEDIKILNKEGSNNILKTFNNLICSQVINSYEVNCFDGKAKYIIEKIFDAYYANPLQLPDNVLRRIDREIKRFDNSWNNIRKGANDKVKK